MKLAEVHTASAPLGYEVVAQRIMDTVQRAYSESWTYDKLREEVAMISLPDVKRGSIYDALDCYVGTQRSYEEVLYSTKGLRARWPDGWREAARIVPDDVKKMR